MRTRSPARVLTAAAASAVSERGGRVRRVGRGGDFSVCHRREREIWSGEIRG